MANNSILKNVAQSAFAAACYAQAAEVGETGTVTDTTIAASAASFATSMDTAIPNDTLISTSAGASLWSGSSPAAIANTVTQQLGKSTLLAQIIEAKASAYSVGSLVAAEPSALIDDLVVAVAAAYTAGVAQLTSP